MPESEFNYEAQLAACARGEPAALRHLYERDARWLMGVALRIVRRRELADEVLHDAFLRIWQKAASYNVTLGSARGWICSIVRHRALDVAQQHRRELPGFETLLEELPASGPGPLDTLNQSRESGALHHCLKQLDEQKRACILLAYVDGYSQTQIAIQLASPLGTVKAWTRRGLQALKECLS